MSGLTSVQIAANRAAFEGAMVPEWAEILRTRGALLTLACIESALSPDGKAQMREPCPCGSGAPYDGGAWGVCECCSLCLPPSVVERGE